jgi:hypothetical protein
MNADELAREYVAALRSTQFAHLGPLLEAGVGGRALAIAAPSLMRIEVEKGGLYQPSPDGRPHFITPVRVDGWLSPESCDPDETAGWV